ncbi:hypothetical protein A2Z67_06260 [Candidatus Woesebacteria bacterium RBG_13_36_22]|uniref:Uncharacterized protein n=1 Tax=Candidatus Woesebacteria bacterium RBG_13_36_22 TaxID=1802478 RepID=A0A1F7WZH5_9BACT|nr:MAG: hypothetical protein A2Z67_06260 [Candidatus Woesebacteria bacterium RBG_13_36_22]
MAYTRGQEPAVFTGGDGFLFIDGFEVARRVESSVEVAMEYEEIQYQGQYTVGALVLKSIKISGTLKQAVGDLDLIRKLLGGEVTTGAFAGSNNSLPEQFKEGDQIGGRITDVAGNATAAVQWVKPVDIILQLDKSRLPSSGEFSIANYETVLISNAVFQGFTLPVGAGAAVMTDLNWLAENMAFQLSPGT